MSVNQRAVALMGSNTAHNIPAVRTSIHNMYTHTHTHTHSIYIYKFDDDEVGGPTALKIESSRWSLPRRMAFPAVIAANEDGDATRYTSKAPLVK